jgi:hypothetical protein
VTRFKELAKVLAVMGLHVTVKPMKPARKAS